MAWCRYGGSNAALTVQDTFTGGSNFFLMVRKDSVQTNVSQNVGKYLAPEKRPNMHCYAQKSKLTFIHKQASLAYALGTPIGSSLSNVNVSIYNSNVPVVDLLQSMTRCVCVFVCILRKGDYGRRLWERVSLR